MNKINYFYCLVALLAAGCQPTVNNNPISDTQVNNNNVIETQIIPTSEPSPTALPVLSFNKILNDNNFETDLSSQCLNIASVPPTSNSVIVLRSLQDVYSHQSPDVILVDMSVAELEETLPETRITPSFAVSIDRKLIAYAAPTISDGKVIKLNLTIANGNLQTQKSIPWDDKWDSILGWTTDQKIILSLVSEETSRHSVSYVLVDPLNDVQQEIHLDIPDFLDKSLYDLPYWQGWYGLLIDPSLNLAVYPRQSGINKEMYTYALWDISNNKTMLSLENIFSAFLLSIDSFPVPSWSADGRQFAFVGVNQDVLPIKFELFLVNREGDVKQLTNLSEIAYVWPSSHSWSSDNSHIAIFLGPPLGAASKNANVAILNTDTLEVIDLCLAIGFQGSLRGEPITPIWSPNGKQFLIEDRYEKDHQRVLLVDIEKGIVFQVAEDAEPIGWMVKP